MTEVIDAYAFEGRTTELRKERIETDGDTPA